MREEVVAWETDLSEAQWLVDSIGSPSPNSAYDVSVLVPAGYDAFARVLHQPQVRGRTTWSEVARANDRVVHRRMQYDQIAPRSGDGPTPGAPACGSLAHAERAALAVILQDATSTPQRCWTCISEGYLDGPLPPLVEIQGMRYGLTCGPIEQMIEGHLDPFDHSNFWWPDDRAWIVATEIDLDSTYVGATAKVVQRIVRSPDLEAFEARYDDEVHRHSDVINQRDRNGSR